MKGIKKLLTGILAGAMATAMCFSAGNATEVKAANDGKVIVSNTTKDLKYNLYKIFDATYQTVTETEGTTSTTKTNVAYTFKKDDANVKFYEALADENSSPFILTDLGNDLYSVTRKDEESDTSNSAIIKFIEDNGPTYDSNTNTWSGGNYGNPIATENGTGGEIKFEGLAYGYYFVTSNLGAVVTINNATPIATVIDKNQETTLDKQEQVAQTWEYVGKGTPEGQIVPTQSIGQVVNYKLEGTVTQYVGTDKVSYLEFTDVMTSGLTYDPASLTVKIGDKTLSANANEYTVNTTVNDDTFVTTTVIHIPTVKADGSFLYSSNEDYIITYSATINERCLDTIQNNTVTLKDDNGKTLGTDSTEVKNYKITLTKTAKADGKALADAEFLLYTSETGETKIPVVLVPNNNQDVKDYGTKDSNVNNVYRVAKEGETPTAMVTGITGVIEIKGLKNGNYYLEETKAPNGYNKLAARVKVIPAEKDEVKNPQNTSILNADGKADIENTTGTLLPSTGGIGTTIFYIIGGILIIAGVAYFIVRRKAEA